jgi:hypothetical protein
MYVGETKPVSDACPYCSAPMRVTEMACGHCRVNIRAAFPMARLGHLPVEHQRFIEMFVLCGGNLKELGEQVGVSYPTIRTRLDRVIEALRGEISKTRTTKGTPLDAVDDGSEGVARMMKAI